MIFQVGKPVKSPKKHRVPKRPRVALKKPLPLTEEEDVEEEDEEEDDDVQVVGADEFPGSSSRQLDVLKRAVDAANSNLRKDVDPHSCVNCVLQGKRCVRAKGVGGKQAPTSCVECKSHSNKSISCRKVSLCF